MVVMWFILSRMLMVGAQKAESYLEGKDLISLFHVTMGP